MPSYDLGTASGRVTITTDIGDLETLRRALADLGPDGDRAGRRLGSGLEQGAAAARSVGKATSVAGLGIVAALGGAVKTAADFESGLSGIKAVSGATAGQMDLIRAAALRIGADTSFSASEASDAISELAKAGVSVKDILNGAADATVALAAAGGVDLPEAATIASNAMNQFGLSAKDLPKVADLIAGAANASAIDVSQFGYSLSQAGAVAHLAGVPFEDLTVAIGELGNAGIVGSDAGTSLKTTFSRLNPTTKAARDQMEQLGLYGFDTGKALKYLATQGVKPASDSQGDLVKSLHETVKAQLGSGASAAQVEKAYQKLTAGTQISTSAFYDQQGNLKPLKDVQEILRKSLVGMTADQKQAALGTIFGSDAIRAAAVLAGNGAKGYDKLSAAINKTKAADVAKTRLDNFNGAVQTLQGSIETVAINIGSTLLPVLKTIVDGVTGVVNAFGSIPAPVQGIIAVVGVVAGVIATLAGALLFVVGSAIPVVGAIAGVVTAVGGLAVVGPIVAGVAGLVAAFALVGAAVVLFLTKTEAGRAIVAGFVSGIQASFKALTSFVTPIVTAVGNAVQDLGARAKTGFDQVVAAAAPFVAFFQNQIVPVVKPAIDAVVDAVGKFGPAVASGFGAVGKTVGDTVNFLVQNVGPVLSDVFTNVSAVVTSAGQFIADAWTQIQPAVQPVVDFFVNTVGPNLGTVLQVVGTAVGVLVGVVLLLSTPFVGAAIAVGVLVAALVGIGVVVANVAGFLAGLAANVTGAFSTAFGAVAGVVSGALNAVTSVISGVISTVGGIISGGLNVVVSVFRTVFNAVAPVVSSAFNSVRSIISSVISIIRSLVQAGLFYVRQIFTTVFNALAGIVGPPLNAAKSAVTTAVNGIKSVVTTVFNTVRSFVTTVFNAIKSAISGPINEAKSAVSTAVGAIKSAVSSAFNSAKATVKSAMDALARSVSDGIGKAVDFFKGLGTKITGALSGVAGDAYAAGAKIVGQLVSGLLSGLEKIASAAASIAAKVKAALPHSPAKEGPFSGSGWSDVERSGLAIANQLASGLYKGAQAAGTAAQAVVQVIAVKIKAAASAAATTSADAFGDLGKSIGGAFRDGLLGSSQQVQDSVSKLADDINTRLTTVVDDRQKALDKIKALNKEIGNVAGPKRKPAPVLRKTVKGKVTKAAQDSYDRQVKADKASYASSASTAAKRKADLRKQVAEQQKTVAALTKLTNPRAQSTITTLLNRDNPILQRLADQRDAIADQLKDAQSALDTAVKTRDDYASSVAGSVAALGNVAKGYTDALAQAKQAAADAVTLQGKIDDLDASVAANGSDRQTLVARIAQRLAASTDDRYSATARSAAVAAVAALTDQLAAVDRKAAAFATDRAALTGQLAAAQRTAASPVGLLVQGLQDDVDRTRQFQATIAQLKARGLDDTSYKQLVDDFVSDGDTSNAQAFAAAGDDTIRRVADLQKQLQAAGASLGAATSTSLYQAGVDAARGLVDGLTSQQAALEAAMTSIADSLVARIKSQLQIKSPSRRMSAEVGVPTVMGIVDGIMSAKGLAVKAASALVGAVTGATAGVGLMPVGAWPGGIAIAAGGAGAVSSTSSTVNYNDYSRGDGAISDEDRLKRALVRSRVLVAGW